jgi:HD-like signal output (HDOD) protein
VQAAAEATRPGVALAEAHVEDPVRPAPPLPVVERTTRVAPEAPAIEPKRPAAPVIVEVRRVPATPAQVPAPSPTPAPAQIPARSATPAPAFVATRPVPYAPAPAAVPAPAPAVTSAQPSAEATIQTLLSRLQRRGDFPAFARTIGEVSHKADANGTFSAGQLGETILKDYALTSKLLRIVNATYARRFGGKIYSIQHAIVILGFDRVRSLALSISLFKTQGTGKGNERVSESAISALVSSEIGRHLAPASRVNDDEATVCAMFKNLGRHLVLVYLPELYDQIEGQVASGSSTLSAASKRVLGATFEELGTAIAKAWQLPEHVIGAIGTTGAPDGELERPGDRLNALARFANELCDIVTREAPETRERAIKRLLAGYMNLIGINGDALAEMLTHIEESLSERYAALLGGDLKSSRFVMNVSGAPPAAAGNAELAEGHLAPRARPVASFFASTAKSREQHLAHERALPAALAEGAVVPLEQRIAELRVSADRGMPADTVLTEALRLVCEHTRARSPLVLTATANKQHLVVRFGLRDDLEGLKRELKFPLRLTGGRPQIFANAYHAGKDCAVNDCFSQESSETLPTSYYEVLGSAALALFACLGKGVTPALLLIEAETPAALPTAARMTALADLRPLIARAAART